MFLATSRWFGLRLDLIMVIFTCGITIGAVPLVDCKYAAISTDYFLRNAQPLHVYNEDFNPNPTKSN